MGEGDREISQQREAGRAQSRTEIRGLQIRDLHWLRPIAEKYGEWGGLLAAAKHEIRSWVIEPKAIMMLYRAEDGIEAAGLCDVGSMKAMIRVARACYQFVEGGEITVHTHVQGGWQYKLFQEFGFRPAGDRLILGG